jgi:hypothetical protein
MNLTTNTAPFIHAEQYSAFILQNLHDGFLPTTLYRNVSDFGEGTTLNIKTVGTVTLQDVAEDTALTYQPLETGTVQLTITDYVGNAWYVTDVLKQDGSQIETLMAMHGMENTRAIQENFETRYLATANAAQTATDLNNINGHAHRFVASGTNQTIELADFITMKTSFDKANVPQAGRIAIVDPIVEATLLTKFQASFPVDSNPRFQSIMENNFSMEHKFIMNLYGWDIWTSNRLPDIASETINSISVTNGKANIFMSVLDDNTKPVMVAWRQQPKVEGERNKDRQRDEFVTTARWGVGVQRVDTLGVILSDAVATS